MRETNPRHDSDARALLARVGRRVRRLRQERDMTRRALAAASGVSERFLAALEGGTGNVSIARLRDISEPLGVTLDELVREEDLDADGRALLRAVAAATPEERAALRRELGELRGNDLRSRRIALLGLRGAGKSTLGRRVGARLGIPFVELNDEIARASGLSVNEIFSLYGEEGFRRLERQCLERLAEERDQVVLAAPGGVVGEPDTYAFLLARYRTVWLRATPEEHMSRVRAQGDQRPMEGHPRAMDDLRAILSRRERDYARAPHHIDTSGQALEASTDALSALIERLLAPASEPRSAQ